MQRTLKYALTAALGAALAVPALAQDNFPDVPDNHWAYEALLRMKSNGLLVGYPDGLYRGGRPASRYEMAVAIHATYVNLKNITDGLQRQIDELKAQMGTGNGGDIQSLRTALENLQNEVAGMRGNAQAIADLRRLTETFQKELQDLNVDVEQMKRDLSDLSARVEILEKSKPALALGGDATLWVASGEGRSGRGHLDKDGRFSGARLNGGQVRATSFLQDLTVLHEAAINFKTTREKGPKLEGELVVGNFLGGGSRLGAFYDQNVAAYGQGYREPRRSDVYLQRLGVAFQGRLGNLRGDVEIGRLGVRVSPYILQRPDYTTYMDNPRWDNGEYTFDGVKISTGVSRVKLDFFGGRISDRFSTNGVDLNPIFAFQNFPGLGGGAPNFARTGPNFDQFLGARARFALGDRGGVDLSYLLLDARNPTVFAGVDINRMYVYGANVDFSIGGAKLIGGYAKSDLARNNDNRNDEDNESFYVGLGYERERFGIKAQYRQVDEFFVAPGDWGRLGILRNPTNIQGVKVDGYFNINNRLKLKAGGEFDKGKDNTAFSPFADDTDINSFNVGLEFNVSNNLGLMASYEETRFDDLPFALIGGGDTRYRWFSFGLGYSFSETTRLRLSYEISDHENDFLVPLLNPGAPTSADGDYRGGFLTTSLSIKF